MTETTETRWNDSLTEGECAILAIRLNSARWRFDRAAFHRDPGVLHLPFGSDELMDDAKALQATSREMLHLHLDVHRQTKARRDQATETGRQRAAELLARGGDENWLGI